MPPNLVVMHNFWLDVCLPVHTCALTRLARVIDSSTSHTTTIGPSVCFLPLLLHLEIFLFRLRDTYNLWGCSGINLAKSLCRDVSSETRHAEKK